MEKIFEKLAKLKEQGASPKSKTGNRANASTAGEYVVYNKYISSLIFFTYFI
jgi:hypothetical protein